MNQKRLLFILFIIFFVISSTLVFAGYYYYQVQKNYLKTSIQNHLEAIAHLLWRSQTNSKFTVVMLGNGPERAALQERARVLRVEKVVFFAGYRTDVRDLIAGCDFVILPSISHEDFPISILEAMSVSKAVIASRVAGIPEQVEDRVTGLLVEPGDVRGLSGAISELCGSQEMRETYGKNGRERFLRYFTAERSIVAYTSLYKQSSE